MHCTIFLRLTPALEDPARALKHRSGIPCAWRQSNFGRIADKIWSIMATSVATAVGPNFDWIAIGIQPPRWCRAMCGKNITMLAQASTVTCPLDSTLATAIRSEFDHGPTRYSLGYSSHCSDDADGSIDRGNRIVAMESHTPRTNVYIKLVSRVPTHTHPMHVYRAQLRS